MPIDFDALARLHMADQVRGSALVEASLAVTFDQLMDPEDVDGSFPGFLRSALELISVGREKGIAKAAHYYGAMKLLSGLTLGVPEIVQPTLDTVKLAKTLLFTGPVLIKTKLLNGADITQAMGDAKAATLRAAKKGVLSGGRQHLIDLAKADPDSHHWARVSDDDPCYFCAMLVSRGPVYAENTAYFQAHDGCGCSARPVFRNDPSDGWSPEAEEFRDLYEADPLNWRSAYDAFRDDTRRDKQYAEAVKKSGGSRGPANDLAGSVRTPDGGFTYDPERGETITAGFGVSPYPERSKVITILDMTDDEIMAAIHEFDQDNKDVLSKEGNYIGAWHDPGENGKDEGKVYLDVSVVTDSAKKARQISIDHDQIAFYDFQAGESVTVDRNAKSGQG